MPPESPLRYVWLVVGWISVGLALAGAALPLLPTTPFLLVAAFAFSRSSDRWYNWLNTHPQFGPLIRDWREHRAIARSVKVASSAALGGVMVLGAATVKIPWVLFLQAAVLGAVACFIWSRPDPPTHLGP